MAKKLPFLKVKDSKIVNEDGRPVMLRGVNLGGWLMMEGYMFGGRNIPERAFREQFSRALGKDELDDLIRSFREAFIRKSDIETIKGWGANCIRVPFNYKLIEFEDRPFSLNEEGLSYLDRIVEWCGKYSLYCILDMHATPGAQNPAWHSDCGEKPELFTNDVNKDRFLRLWHFIADRYKDSSTVAGYDVMNEPVVGVGDEGVLKDLYDRATKEIRDADKNHIIILEGNLWSQRIRFLGKPEDDNTVFSVHAYPPLDFTHNFEIGLKYPGRVYGLLWNKKRFEMMAGTYFRTMKRTGMPFYVGEFGVNARDGHYGELKWVEDMLGMFETHGLSWTYWTYKTIANYAYPDGIYRYVKNPPWVNHQGPVSGWETFSSVWPKEKGSMIFSWRTENFVRNDKLFNILKRYF